MKQCSVFCFAVVAVAMLVVPSANAQQQYLGEIRFVGFNFAPTGWALCNGQSMSIAQNTALFSLLGTLYGGDGITNFDLPNLQGRLPIHQGSNGVNNYTVGQTGGQEAVTLTVAQMPKHSHALRASGATATAAAPAGQALADSTTHAIYSTQGPIVNMNTASIGASGGSQPVATMPPYLTVTCIIALEGIYPPRN